MKIAFSTLSLILFLTTYMNCPTVRLAWTRYCEVMAIRKSKQLIAYYYVCNSVLAKKKCAIVLKCSSIQNGNGATLIQK
jgi:hypothetical protein